MTSIHFISQTSGNAIAAQIRVELKASVEEIKALYGVAPGLAVVLVGEYFESQILSSAELQHHLRQTKFTSKIMTMCARIFNLYYLK